MSFLLVFGQTAPVLGNPTGGTVAAGSATISSSGSTETINQSTSAAIINWQQFSISSGELTKFLVPSSSSATLNRVLGGNPSLLYGTLQSNGIVYLINPSGIVVGPSGVINTAGFIGSTLDITDDEFLQGGNLNFVGGSGAGISNQGVINATSGDVYLIAAQVNNSGTITAPQGNVGLAAGSSVLYQPVGNQHLFIQSNPTGTTRAVGITNSGTVQAATAELRAAGGNAYALAINNTGNIAATGFQKVNGQVYLTSDGGNITNSGQISAQNPNGSGGTVVVNGHSTTGATTGTVINSGSITAQGTAPGTTGGTVELLGDQVGITGNGLVDVSGEAGGGTALIGGGEHGADPSVPDAEQTYLGPDAQVLADALLTGNGGEVILWSNQNTEVEGLISVRGGVNGGDGGYVETSGAQLEVLTAPDLAAPNGQGGTWLLDPSDITISDTGSPTVTQATLLSELESGGTVILDANTGGGTGSGAGGTGTITWTQTSGDPLDLTLTSTSTLELNATGGITITGVTVNTSGTGGLSLVFNQTGLGETPGNVSITGSTLNLNGGNFTANGQGFASTTSSTSLDGSDGVDVFSSTINAQGGDITLNGTAGYYLNTYYEPAQISAGTGVNIGDSLLETIGLGNITITGIGPATAITSVTGFTGVNIGNSLLDGGTGSPSTVSAVNGTISITGNVPQGTAGGSADNGGGVTGIQIEGASVVEATGNGSVILNGDVSGSDALATGSNGYSTGIEIGGYDASSTSVSVGAGGSITINGTGGTLDASNATDENEDGNGNTPYTQGVSIDSGSIISGGAASTITITGTGGAVITTTAYTGGSSGVSIDSSTISMASGGTLSITGYGGAVNAGDGAYAANAETDGVDFEADNGSCTVSVAVSGSISITGTGGSLNISNASPVMGSNFPGATGVSVDNGADVTATGAAAITIMGTGGSVTAATGSTGGEAAGVSVGNSGDHSILNTVVSSVSGAIQITGIAGSTPNLGIGVVLHGFNKDGTEGDNGVGTVESTSGNITITGTGGSGYTGTGYVVGDYIPNYGVALVDNATVETGGNISLTGTGGSNSLGVDIQEITGDPTLDTNPVLPTISAVNGSLTVTTAAGGSADSGDINLSGVDAAEVLLNAAGNVTQSGAITTALLSITNAAAVTLDNAANAISALGNIQYITALSIVTDPGLVLNGVISGSAPLTLAATGGNVTFAPAGQIDVSGSGNSVVIAAGTDLANSGYIINNSTSGANAIQVTGGATFDLYSGDPTGDSFGGITVSPANVIYGATYPYGSLPSGNAELFYVAAAGDVGPNSPPNSNSNSNSNTNNTQSQLTTPTTIINPQQPPPNNNNGNTSPSNPLSDNGSGNSNQTGTGGGQLADSSGSSGDVSSGDTAQLNDGQLNNVTNPAASSALNQALSPAVLGNLTDALQALGDFDATAFTGGNGGNNGGGNGGNNTTEQDMSAGDVVEIGDNGVKNIPLSQAPQQLKDAMSSNALQGVPTQTSH